MNFLRVFTVFIFLTLGAGFIGCGGGGADIKTSNTTVGQELMDLEKAYKNNIITEKEYNKTKSKILKRKY
jgi:DUF917 family protein